MKRWALLFTFLSVGRCCQALNVAPPLPELTDYLTAQISQWTQALEENSSQDACHEDVPGWTLSGFSLFVSPSVSFVAPAIQVQLSANLGLLWIRKPPKDIR